jgi:hypothetical protein
MQSSPASRQFLPSSSKYSPQHCVLKHFVRDQVSHPYKTEGKIMVLYILIFKCLAKGRILHFRYSSDRRLSVPQSRPGRGGEEKEFLPLTVVQPVA